MISERVSKDFDSNVAAIRGYRFVLWALSPLVAVLVALALARWYPFSDSSVRSGAVAMFLEATRKLGTTPTDYSGPHESTDDRNATLQLCWKPLQPSMEELCAIYVRHGAELNIYRVRRDPVRYELLK